MSGATSDEYFINLTERGAAHAPLPVPDLSKWPNAGADALPLASGSARPMQVVLSVLLVLGGPILGFGVPFLLYLFFSIGFWGSSSSDGVFYVVLGVCIAAVCIAAGIITWLPWRSAPALLFDDDAFRVRYPGFRRPLRVPRALIRAATIDDRPVHFFHRNDRFPVEGDLPEAAYVDALDVHPADPWQPRDPADPGARFPVPSGPSKPARTFLFSADGSALPFLRVNPEDVPNVAVLLHEPLPTPRPPLGAFLAARCKGFYGGRPIHGLMVRVSDATRVRAAFARWDVVRRITAEDVLDEHLSLPKPLTRVRGMVYGVVLLVPVLLRIIFRHRI